MTQRSPIASSLSGPLHLTAVRSRFRTRLILQPTQLYGVIGHPVQHSLSPAMHNAAFAALRWPGIYLAWDILPSAVGNWIAVAHALGVQGFNVTVPHKEHVAHVLGGTALSPEARLVGAVNTVVQQRGGWVGHNTDAHGFLEALRQDVQWRPRGRRVVLLGAGGAARAVAVALVRGGARVTIANRTASRARALARWISRRVPRASLHTVSWRAAAIGASLAEADLLVNATSLGLRAGDRLPVAAADLRRHLVVYDLVYGRRPTWIVVQAQRRGLVASDGLGMLLYQGARAFELWTGRKAPVDMMRRALRARLTT